MDNTAAQMNVVFAQLTFDVCKVPFHPDVAEVEQGQGELYQCKAGFLIDTSGVSHTDGEVYIPHHFGEDNRWNL